MVTKQKSVQRCKELYKHKTGKELSDQEALEHFEKLTTLVSAIFEPIPIALLVAGRCSSCPEMAYVDKFETSEDVNEYLISGMCKECQDKTFKHGKS